MYDSGQMRSHLERGLDPFGLAIPSSGRSSGCAVGPAAISGEREMQNDKKKSGKARKEEGRLQVPPS